MAERKKPAVASQRSGSQQHNEKSKAAARANMAKGRAIKAKLREEARKQGRTSAAERWAKLLDGTLTVEDLDDREVESFSVWAKDGSIARRRRMPSHLVEAFRREAIKRAKHNIDRYVHKASKTLVNILDDPEASNADKIKAIQILFDRAMGKAPETIRVEAASKWDDLMGAAVEDERSGVGLDQELKDLTKGGE